MVFASMSSSSRSGQLESAGERKMDECIQLVGRIGRKLLLRVSYLATGLVNWACNACAYLGYGRRVTVTAVLDEPFLHPFLGFGLLLWKAVRILRKVSSIGRHRPRPIPLRLPPEADARVVFRQWRRGISERCFGKGASKCRFEFSSEDEANAVLQPEHLDTMLV